jgi:beta-barrel assembly-enhancing protease
VISVVAGSPAAYAGIKVGDQIQFLDQDPVPATNTAGFVAAYLRSRGKQPVRVALTRDGVEQAVMVTPVMACAIPIDYVAAETVNAFATEDKKITLYAGIVALARTDAQLAHVIGNELAHANLGHSDKKRLNMLLGMASGLVVDGGFALGGIYTDGTFAHHLGQAGLMAYSVAFEREADHVGAYYAARAGYDLAGVENFWRAMGAVHPDSIRFATTHPTTPTRFIQIREVAAEIADKKRRHLPLVPDLKFPPEPAAADSNY